MSGLWNSTIHASTTMTTRVMIQIHRSTRLTTEVSLAS